ncbi:putative ATP-dependent RNA helicase TDRD12 [Phymastichus coffea]|uniref:putative ATP-dependent RNA helicase TDRD12 n=1 Tax=Phymastichus coffea TaxID=108790 RepID=UPI00273B4ED6|nr:putative ATP-dependent RNA helicase TDRD12 [Phymastichus coffea]
MAVFQINECLNIPIPSTAKEVIITNILSPYFIQALDAVEDGQKKKELNHLLEKISKSFFKKKENSAYLPKINHHVVISAGYSNPHIDLPSWFCRGTVVDICSTTTDVLLIDYGTVVNVPNESIARYPSSAIPVEPLSFTFCIYNILPLDSERNVCKEWPKDTIKFIKDLIESSTKIYLEILAHHKRTNRIFGDLFLIIDNKNLSLRKFMIESNMGLEWNDELMQAIKNSKLNEDVIFINKKKPNLDQSTNSESDNNFPKASKRVGILKKVEVLDKILIRSNISCNVQPLDHLANSRFATSVHKALKANGVSKLKQIQSYMWPAIKQGFNVTTIAPTSSGKTLGYIVPIIHAIAENEEMIEKQKNDTITKPFVLVLCATLKTCTDVTEAFNIVSTYNKNIKSCAFYSGISDKDLMTKICNKFQIIVSTPTYLLRLLSKSFASDLNISELSYLVLDHADIILSKYLKEVISLIKDYKIINKDFNGCIQGGLPQTIIVSRTWTNEIDSFVSNFVENSYTCIGSFTEAAAYNGVQGRMLIRHSDKKKNEVLGAIKNYKTQKTMIFCLDSTEASELNKFLMANGVKTLLVHDEMKITQIDERKNELKKYLPGMFPVIICTDEILSEFPVSDAEFLIHYSVTSTSKTQFNRRFSVLMENWIMELDKKCRILIFFDETKECVHFKGVVDILKRFKVDLPEDWNVIADGLEIQDNMKKKNYPLCNNIKSFGYCNSNQSCSDRHRVIAETDVPQISEISIGDELKLLVTYIHSVTHYTARVLECKKGDQNVVTLPHKIAQLSMKLKNCYSNSENRRSPKVISPGLICVAKNGESFTRVRILKIVEEHVQTNKPRIVKYQSIDDGNIRDRVNVHELYEIMDEFLNYKLPIVNVYLTGISPFDEENEWGNLANNSVKEWFDKNLRSEREPYVYAKTLLHIGDSIWTDSLVFRSKILGYGELVSSSLKKVMIEEGHGVENKKHLSHLIHLCISSGITEINSKPIEFPKEEQESKDE